MSDEIPDSILDQFRLLAAKMTLDEVPTSEIVALADQTLAQGFYHEALRAIVDCRPPTRADIAPHLIAIFNECQVPIGDAKWALRYLMVHFITRMALPDSEPEDELMAFLHSVGGRLGQIYKDQQALGLSQIFRLEMQYNYYVQLRDVPADEIESARRACMNLATELRNAAKDWLEQYASFSDDRSGPS